MKVRAAGLISGGLDSMLAARLLMEQGIEVTGISFVTPFFSSDKAEAAAVAIGFPLIVRDLTAPHLEIVKDPPSGYGANMNPCIDCHALMLREAGRLMEREGWDFLFTGEVVHERPMSQNPRSLNRVANLSGYRDLVLRPLSARLLRETGPEREGKVDRSRLLDIQGRSRRRQFELARRWGITDYPTPAGGCLLTDPGFSRRLRDLLEGGPEGGIPAVEMLKVGRHFRIRENIKVIVGRNKKENERLLELAGKDDTLVDTTVVPGPVAVLCGDPAPGDLRVATGLCARYSDADGPVEITLTRRGGTSALSASPLNADEIERLRI